MKHLATIWSGLLVCSCVVPMASAANVLKPVSLPFADGKLVGASFSPDSSRLAIIRTVAAPGGGQRHVLQIVEMKSGLELTEADVLTDEPVDLAMNAHLISYSSDGRYLLVAARGSDVLSILDAATLRTLKRVALHPETDSRITLGEGHRYFRGVISLTASAKGNVFGVLTHDELQGNEAFVGSFSSGQSIKGWSLGKGRVASQLRQTSLSLNQDGSNAVVSVLPDENRLPKAFNNLRLYNSRTGKMMTSVRTKGLIGQVMLLSGNSVLAASIDTPSLLSKNICIEKWNLSSGKLGGQFCDGGRNVSATLSAAPSADRVVGFASQIHKSIEGQVYTASGRLDVWDMRSGNLVASSDEIPHFVSSVQISANGEWVLADQVLLQLNATR